MAFNANAWANDGGTYGEDSMRDLVHVLSGGQGGVVGGTDALKVVQQAAPAATVRVNAGGFVIPATAAGETGSYTDWNDGYLTSPAFTPTGVGVSRKDRVILRVTAGVSAVEIVQGTAAASPTEPSITGDNYLELALVTLPASTSNITDAMITDRRVRMPAAHRRGTSTVRAALTGMVAGDRFYETDTITDYLYTGSAWLISAAGWTAFTPTWRLGANAVVLGNATNVGRYRRVGNAVEFYAKLIVGSTTSFPANDTFLMDLPVNAYDGSIAVRPIGTASGIDASTGAGSRAFAEIAVAANRVGFYSTAGAYFTGTSPWTWATGDSLFVTGSYEAS